MLIANTLKSNLNSQKTTNVSWLVTMIKAILKTPIQKSENPIFLSRRPHEAAVRNSKILTENKMLLRRRNCGKKGQPCKLRIGILRHRVLSKKIFHREDKTKIINIIQQGSRCHLNAIPKRTDIERKFRVARGGPGINTTTPSTRTDRDSGAVESEVREGSQVTKPTPPAHPQKY